MALPEHWFDGVKKLYVIERVDYYTRKGSTTIIISYKPWWKLPRQMKFPRIPTKQGGAAMHERHPDAVAIVNRIKAILDPTFKKALFDQYSPIESLKSALPPFMDVPRFTGWPTAK